MSRGGGKVRVYFYSYPRRRVYVVYDGEKTTSITVHAHAHEYIAKTLPDGYRFYLVFAQPHIVEKTNAFLKVLEVEPQFREKVGVMVSFALMDAQTLECIRKLKRHNVEVILDSGAFHVLNRRMPIWRYQAYRKQYLDFINRHIDLFDWVVTMDIPCDNRPDQSIQKMSNIDKVRLTVENTIHLIDHVADPRKFMAVVQGYRPEEYAYCCDLLKQHGIITARMGIGSLCARKYDRKARREVSTIIDIVRRSLPGWVKLHAFGLNIRFLQHIEIRSKLYSSDSGAWAYSYARFERLPILNYDGDITEIDLSNITRRGRRLVLDEETIYFHSIRTYLEKLKIEGILP